MLRRKTLFITIIITLFVFIGLFKFYDTSNTHSANSKADVYIDANKLVSAYLSNEKKANNLYTNKLIKVSGILKKITYLNDRSTLIIDNSSYGIICDLNKSEFSKLAMLQKGKKIKVLGMCKGFLKDVILLNCYIETNQ